MFYTISKIQKASKQFPLLQKKNIRDIFKSFMIN